MHPWRTGVPAEASVARAMATRSPQADSARVFHGDCGSSRARVSRSRTRASGQHTMSYSCPERSRGQDSVCLSAVAYTSQRAVAARMVTQVPLPVYEADRVWSRIFHFLNDWSLPGERLL